MPGKAATLWNLASGPNQWLQLCPNHTIKLDVFSTNNYHPAEKAELAGFQGVNFGEGDGIEAKDSREMGHESKHR